MALPLHTVTFHAPLSGFWLSVTTTTDCVAPFSANSNSSNSSNNISSKSPSILVYNVDTGELALTIVGPCQGIVIDRTATKILIGSRPRTGIVYEAWSIVRQTYLFTLPNASIEAKFNKDGSKVLCTVEDHALCKRLALIDTDTAEVLWSLGVEIDGSCMGPFEWPNTCFSASQEHVVISRVQVNTLEGKRDHITTLQSYVSDTGGLASTLQVPSFCLLAVQTGFGTCAVIATGNCGNQLGVIVVDMDLAIARVILIPQDISGNLKLAPKIRFGPSATVMIGDAFGVDVEVVAYNCDMTDEIQDSQSLVRKICRISLASTFNDFARYASQISSNRLAQASQSRLARVAVYDVNTGSRTSVFECPGTLNQLGSVESDMCVLL
jgi:hypothetical protein